MSADGLVTVGAGTSLHGLIAELVRQGWSLTNLGDIDRQTVAGALATGTHGTGARFGGLASQVRALELVTPAGEVLVCDATRNPDVFAAARVGLGALGVVTSVTLQAAPAFALRAVEGPGTLSAAIEGFEELMTSTDHVEFYWFPHTDATLLKSNTRVPLEEGLSPLPRWRAVWDDEIVANAAFAGMVAAGRRVPALVPPLARMSARTLGSRSWTDHSHRVFVSRRRVRFLETEYAVPRADAPAVLAELRRVHESNDWRAAFPVEVRLAAADDIPLSPASGRDIAYVAAYVPAGTSPGPWFAALESIAGQVGVGRTGASCTAWTRRCSAPAIRGSTSSSPSGTGSTRAGSSPTAISTTCSAPHPGSGLYRLPDSTAAQAASARCRCSVAVGRTRAVSGSGARTDRRSAARARTAMPAPTSARTAPTHIGAVYPRPLEMTSAPSAAPTALATLNAPWLAADTRLPPGTRAASMTAFCTTGPSAKEIVPNSTSRVTAAAGVRARKANVTRTAVTSSRPTATKENPYRSPSRPPARVPTVVPMPNRASTGVTHSVGIPPSSVRIGLT